jgi:lysophospholipase L1-like esterase
MRTIFLIIISFFFSCESSSQVIDNQKNNMTNGLSYLALGDSYTIGESVNEDQRWPMQLAKSLTSNGIAVSPPQIIAKTGWTTDELNYFRKHHQKV